MRAIAEFVKSTIIGGFFGILPPVLVALLVLQGLEMLDGLASALAEELPIDSVGGVGTATLVGLGLILAACFLVGLFLRTAAGQWLLDLLEGSVLGRLPGYAVLKSLTQRFAGVEQSARFAPALVDLHGSEALALGFVVDDHDSGHFTVLVPLAPTPTVGTLYWLPHERVRLLDISMTKAVNALLNWGIETGDWKPLPPGTRPRLRE